MFIVLPQFPEPFHTDTSFGFYVNPKHSILHTVLLFPVYFCDSCTEL